MKSRIVVLLAGALTVAALTGCSAPAEEPEATTSEVEETAEVSKEMPTADNPIVIDEEAGEVRVYAEVNRKWVTEPTRHGVVTAEGSNADKAIFKAGGNALDFNEALVQIGATPGDNVKKDSPAGTAVEGDALEVLVGWDDSEYSINELVVSSGELGGQELEPKFGGNYDFQAEVKTGCLFCLDSCAAGITSNASVGWKSFDGGKVEFRGNGDLLPADGTAVTVTFRLL